LKGDKRLRVGEDGLILHVIPIADFVIPSGARDLAAARSPRWVDNQREIPRSARDDKRGGRRLPSDNVNVSNQGGKGTSMTAEFNRQAYLQGFDGALAQLEAAAALGERIASGKVRRLLFVGPGAPYHTMSIAKYWIERATTDVEIRHVYPAELLAQHPAIFEADTVAVTLSHSGTTKETVQIVQYLRDTPCTTVVITQHADSPVAQAADHPLIYGTTENGYISGAMLLLAFMGGFLKRFTGWEDYDKLMTSLAALPETSTDASEAAEERAIAEARAYQDDRIFYISGSGPCFSTAYVYGICILLEMQWLHCQPVEAAEFFHGPFEIMDDSVPMILLLGEDPSRPIAERVVEFCQRYNERLMIYDSKDFAMPGVAPEMRGVVAPLVLLAALERMSAHFAVVHDHPLETRRYMGKVEY
jgi:fructoselysine 6-phosphate deglycase